ncbi:hypothetical protein VTJ04DRAFT_2496 [Mycothermus thermophilus]|uniref:uncharacterized protein n=1 Tax=Humicola insolens TaxID=85995 RepID=UPI003744681B
MSETIPNRPNETPKGNGMGDARHISLSAAAHLRHLRSTGKMTALPALSQSQPPEILSPISVSTHRTKPKGKKEQGNRKRPPLSLVIQVVLFLIFLLLLSFCWVATIPTAKFFWDPSPSGPVPFPGPSSS